MKLKAIMILTAVLSLTMSAQAQQYFNGYISPPNGWAGSNWNGNISGYIDDGGAAEAERWQQRWRQEDAYRAQQRAFAAQQEQLEQQTQILRNMQWQQQGQAAMGAAIAAWNQSHRSHRKHH